MALHLRRKKLIAPRLQLWLVGSFVGMASLVISLQFLVLGFRLTDEAASFEGSLPEFAATVPGVLVEALVFSLLTLIPLIFVLGVLWTFRIAGPVHKFEQHLRAVVAGEARGPCVLRRKDRLHDLCELINQATEPLLERQGDEQPEEVERRRSA